MAVLLQCLRIPSRRHRTKGPFVRVRQTHVDDPARGTPGFTLPRSTDRNGRPTGACGQPNHLWTTGSGVAVDDGWVYAQVVRYLVDEDVVDEVREVGAVAGAGFQGAAEEDDPGLGGEASAVHAGGDEAG